MTDIVGDGSIQMCYYGTWYAECDHSWNCAEANVACRQLGYDKASKLPCHHLVHCELNNVLYPGTIGSYVGNADHYFGYWSSIRNYYHSCSGNENSLSNCSYSHYSHCHSSNKAGVRCIASNYI